LSRLFPRGAVPPGDMEGLAATAAMLLDEPPPVPADHPYSLDAMLEATLALYRHLAER